MRLFDHRSADDSSVLQHILKVHQIAVVHMLCIVIGIMEMNDPLFVSLYNILREEHPLGQVTAHLSRHIISLYTVDSRIFIGIFLLYILIVALDE